jgi:hypothetical protein
MAERITKLGKALRNRLTKAEQLLWNYLFHPPLNPLPSREGKVNKRFLPSREGSNRRNRHTQGRRKLPT